MFICPDDDIHCVYSDGELPQNFVAEYEAHVKICPKCSAKLEKLLALKAAFKADSSSISLSQRDLDAGFSRLEARLSYKKVVSPSPSLRTKAVHLFKPKVQQRHAPVFPKTLGALKYFVAGVAASLIVVFAIPRKDPPPEPLADFQPVMRTSISPVSNTVKVDGKVDPSVLSAILSEEDDDSFVYELPVQGSSSPVFVIGGSGYVKKHRKPSLATYDILLPETSENQSKRLLLQVSLPQGSFDLDD